MRQPEPAEFLPIGVIGHANEERPPLLAGPEQRSTAKEHQEDPSGWIEIDLPSGVRVRVDAMVSEKALMRVLRALKGAV